MDGHTLSRINSKPSMAGLAIGVFKRRALPRSVSLVLSAGEVPGGSEGDRRPICGHRLSGELRNQPVPYWGDTHTRAGTIEVVSLGARMASYCHAMAPLGCRQVVNVYFKTPKSSSPLTTGSGK